MAILAALAVSLAACSFATPAQQPTATLVPAPLPSETPTPTPILLSSTTTATSTSTEAPPTPISTPTDQPVGESVRFAVIGDYGNGSQNEGDVAALIKSWGPDLIITTGDNNYPDGTADTIDEHIGQFFSEFISPYYGSYGEGGQENRFFPSPGNHDWHAKDLQPYLDYFTLPGNERYYDFTWGPVHFFAVDSDSDEPDGASRKSIQADWLKAGLAGSDSPWNVVYQHHAPYSSGRHGSNERAQWPFAEWGADVVFSGHDHTYERISKDGIYYFVNGLGGAGRYDFRDVIEDSQVRYNEDHGAMLVEVNEEIMHIQFINREGIVIDVIELTKSEF
jgi:tartrate-resistant acid phosphatase type 5